MGRLTSHYHDRQLIGAAAVIMTISILGWAFAPGTLAAIIVLAPLSFSIGVLSTMLHSTLTQAVPVNEVGSILGVSTAIGSVTRVIGPATGGMLFDVVGTWSPGVFGAGLMLCFVYCAWKYLFLIDRVEVQTLILDVD
jgi:DHA1 family tetracycline resistance protein-like MFS transporter